MAGLAGGNAGIPAGLGVGAMLATARAGDAAGAEEEGEEEDGEAEHLKSLQVNQIPAIPASISNFADVIGSDFCPEGVLSIDII